jgi:hypothetical protein
VENVGQATTNDNQVSNLSSNRFISMEDIAEPSHLGLYDIQTFEAARDVFLRCTARLEVAKTAFPMDGNTFFFCSSIIYITLTNIRVLFKVM